MNLTLFKKLLFESDSFVSQFETLKNTLLNTKNSSPDFSELDLIIRELELQKSKAEKLKYWINEFIKSKQDLKNVSMTISKCCFCEKQLEIDNTSKLLGICKKCYSTLQKLI